MHFLNIIIVFVYKAHCWDRTTDMYHYYYYYLGTVHTSPGMERDSSLLCSAVYYYYDPRSLEWGDAAAAAADAVCCAALRCVESNTVALLPRRTSTQTRVASPDATCLAGWAGRRAGRGAGPKGNRPSRSDEREGGVSRTQRRRR